MKVRVRLAPSPTGCLHIGTARTALFNYLFAKKNNGKFILRIEDTDLERSERKFEADIIEGLRWLGLEWDEGPIAPAAEGQLFTNEYMGAFGPYRQSERLDIYEKYLKQLLDGEFAYHCYCTKEELEMERQAMLAQGMAPKYSGRCRDINQKSVINNRTPQLIRFKLPDRHITFKDMIRGEISFDTGIMGDIAIAKDLRTPLYNFAVVVDDYEMQITHVIRGEDHINNTPKQILFMEALNFPRPHYAHLPLILDPDRSKMSKRYSAASISEYKNLGYLAESLNNFLGLLGWHPAFKEKEVFSLAELIENFNIGRVQKAGAVFNTDKLNWLNAQYIRQMSEGDLAKKLNWEINEKNLKIIKITKDRTQTLNQFSSLAAFFFKLPDYVPELLIWKNNTNEATINILEAVYKLIEKNKVREISVLAENALTGGGRGDVFWPLRVALSGQRDSPGPMEILDILGKEESLTRIKIAINKLRGLA